MTLRNDGDALDETRTRFLGVPFDCFDQAEVLDRLATRPAAAPFAYIVTPNADHIVRLADRPDMLDYYRRAWLCLCDSKPVQVLSRSVGRPLTHVTGSDLTKAIFEQLLAPGDVISLIVAREEVALKLAEAYPQQRFRWHVPPFGVLQNPEALAAAADFIAEEPARFVFLAIGSPQSEVIAARLAGSGRASGIALCIGASLEFITGERPRAPAWMNRMGLEWTYRIYTEPRRLWRRYLFSIPPLIRLYLKELTGRR